MYKLVIANRNYSSWSFRAWLYLIESDIEFEEIRIPLFSESWQEDIGQYSPGGRVPVLLDDDITVWDSMAIMEYVRERNSDAVGWPETPAARAQARSISAEMHSGFLALREELPQNLRARRRMDPGQLSASCRQQIARIDGIWSHCRRQYGGAGMWLFGDFSIADVMFAPVALRCVTYSIPVSEPSQGFVDAICSLESVRLWCEAAQVESEALPFIDDLVPAEDSPLTLG